MSLFAWTLVDDRRSFRYGGLVAGAVVGFLPAVNWVLTYYSADNKLNKLRPPLLTFYGRWFTTPFGYGPDHILGPMEFPRFLGWPEIGGSPTHLVLAVYSAIVVVAVSLALPAAWRYFQTGPFSLRWILLGDTPGGRIGRAAFFGFGTTLTVLTVRGGGLYEHYMIVITPIMTLWVGLLAAFADGGVMRQRGRALLSALVVFDVAIVILLFSYIHTVGDIQGEFGMSWEFQQAHPERPDRSDQRMDMDVPAKPQMPAYQS